LYILNEPISIKTIVKCISERVEATINHHATPDNNKDALAIKDYISIYFTAEDDR
jgi:hypothetical protein